MKKIISILLAIALVFAISSIAFAKGSYVENQSCRDVKVYCSVCGEEGCSGRFGCLCCEQCPGRLEKNGVAVTCEPIEYENSEGDTVTVYVNVHNGEAVNLAGISSCRYESFYDTDDFTDPNITGKEAEIIHKGEFVTQYYWKPLCCENCTGLVGCKCHDVSDKSNTCSCISCAYSSEDFDQKLAEGLEAGRKGYVSGIQTALTAVRDVMYDLFNKLFEFLRIDIILGKEPTVSGK